MNPADSSDPSDLSDPSAPANPSTLSALKTASPEAAANTLLCLINQASYLLHRQLERLEQDFLQHGGFTERLHAARSRQRSRPSDSSGPSPPACPRCGKPMCQRLARKGPRAGQPFWGCSAYPDCTGTRPFIARSDSSDRSDPSDVSDPPASP